MSHTLKVRIYQTNTNAHFNVVEKAVFYKDNGGFWSETDGVLTLIVNPVNTSGMLRFQSQDGKEPFTVLVGMFKQKPWLHILPNIASSDTCVKLLPQYYDNGPLSKIDLVQSFEAQNNNRRNLSVAVKRSEGQSYDIDIVIG
ncbi:fruit body lectin [Xylaria digitata]|nr:fruit body lectin [Xylaria digitata]